ncbi:Solute Carrier Organic Anion Transporter Family Member 5A1 [Manis pentadactyla]|nr:Solute Carrier Organic Anion Transporter Family Member 5A1 [Manis pentadactyla]
MKQENNLFSKFRRAGTSRHGPYGAGFWPPWGTVPGDSRGFLGLLADRPACAPWPCTPHTRAALGSPGGRTAASLTGLQALKQPRSYCRPRCDSRVFLRCKNFSTQKAGFENMSGAAHDRRVPSRGRGPLAFVQGSLPEAPGQALLLPLSSPDPLVMRPGGIQPKTLKVSPVNKSLGTLKALTGPDCDEGADNPAVLCRLPCDDMDHSSEKRMRGEAPKPPSPAANSR